MTRDTLFFHDAGIFYTETRNLFCKSMEWFLYDRGLRYKKVNSFLKEVLYSEPCQTSKMELFLKIINGRKPLFLQKAPS